MNEEPTQSEEPRLDTGASHGRGDEERVPKGNGLGPPGSGPLQSYLTTRDAILTNGPVGAAAAINTVL